MNQPTDEDKLLRTSLDYRIQIEPTDAEANELCCSNLRFGVLDLSCRPEVACERLAGTQGS